MTQNPTPEQIAAVVADPQVSAAWNLYQEARQAAQSGVAAGGAGTARVAVEQTRAAWVETVRRAVSTQG